ncbi:MAG: oligosaccharide flippase family protein [Azospirillaceae bacterium]
MSVADSTLRGIAWTATSGSIQLCVKLATFALVASRLAPAEIGAYGVAAMLVGLGEALAIHPFAESLKQRRHLRRAHIVATFWLLFGLAGLVAAVMLAGAGAFAAAFSAPQAALLIAWSTLALPLAAGTAINDALLARRLRFDVTARAGGIASLIGGAAAIASLLAGAGVWSLLIADLVGRLWRIAHLWRVTRFRPGPPRRLGALRDLMRFNTGSFGAFLIGYADGMAPRFLTGLLLGPSALGYLIVAERVMALTSQLVLGPLSSVTMASVARLQARAEELRGLVLSLYRLAALAGYPAFLGAAVVVPDLARLVGDTWVMAIPVAQLLLLRGLRTTTGVFNVAVLRGLGRNADPLILLGAGLALHAALIPIGAQWGIVGVAVAMLVRTYATWPLGLWLIRRVTGLGMGAQLAAGARCFAAALAMAAIVLLALDAVPAAATGVRLALAIALGAAVYGGLVAVMERRTVWPALRLAAGGQRRLALSRLRAGFGV